MLQNRQLVRIITHIIQQPIYQLRGNLRSPHRHRTHNCAASLIAGHPGDQVLAVIKCFRQVAELGAVSQKVRSHRQHNINWQVLLSLGRL